MDYGAFLVETLTPKQGAAGALGQVLDAVAVALDRWRIFFVH